MVGRPPIEPMEDRSHGHEVLETIKIRVTLDGDLAATISNLIVAARQNNSLPQLIFCEHTTPKLQRLFDKIARELDIANKVEK